MTKSKQLKRHEIDQFIAQFDNWTVEDLPTISFGTRNFHKKR